MIHLALEVRTAIVAIFAALAISSLLVWIVRRAKPEKDFTELRNRIQTWWVISILFFGALAISKTAVIVFLGFVSFLALKEFLSMVPTRRADRRVLFYAYLAVIVQYYLAGIAWYGMFIMFIPVFMFVWLPTRMWMVGQTEGFLKAAGTTHWGLMVAVFSLSHAAFLLQLEPGVLPHVSPQHASETGQTFPGPGLLLFLILMTELNDIFQYMWGKSLGRRKVAPMVSPGKTYAGFVGGALTTVAVATVIGPKLTLLNTVSAAVAGSIIAIAGFAGDLAMSAIKRDLNIKDFGATLPGHGGVLDRVDSLIFTAPLFFHFVNYFYG